MSNLMKTSKEIKKVSREIFKNLIINTEYGRLAILKPMVQKKFLESSNIVIKDISYVDDNTSSNYAFSIMKNKPDYILYRPEGHFGNALSLYKSIKKKINNKYFGNEKEPSNPFRNCNNAKDIFNLSRNIKFNMKMELSRYGLILLKNGEINIQYKEISTLQKNINIQAINKDFINVHEKLVSENNLQNEKFSKYDYFMSMEMFEGIISANNYIQKGISISALGNRKVYSNYGVFNPTRQDYINLFDSYLKENINEIKKSTKNCIDLGCGTGILSFMMSNYGLNRIFAVDNNPKAIEATKLNSQSLGYHENIKEVLFDMQENYLEENPNQQASKNINLSKNYNSLVKTLNIDQFYDLIVVNPPWLSANYIFTQSSFENSVYDPDNRFLRSSFHFASIHLNRNNNDARFLIIFSDLGDILNVNEPDLIEKLALQHKLKITNVLSKLSEQNLTNNLDPLKNYKKESKIIIYELKRII